MIFNCGPRGSGSSSGIDFGGKFNPMRHLIFSYDNKTNISLEDTIDDGICRFTSSNDDKWELKILQNCNIEFTKQIENIIVFMAGGGDGGNGGKAGNSFADSYYESTGGDGGNGGKILQVNNQTFLKDTYTFEIGTGGNGALSNNSNGDNRIGHDSKILLNNNIKLTTNNSSIQASGGTGAYSEGGDWGGTGDAYSGQGPNKKQPATKGNNGTKFHGIYYGSGGGGGRNYASTPVYIYMGKYGGENGGGKGMGYNDDTTIDQDSDGKDKATANLATPGSINTGGGGGGGSARFDGKDYSDPKIIYSAGADGGSGIIILSNYE